MRHYHIIGAGMAGLASAVKLADKYVRENDNITLYEAAPQAGGRCRSFSDTVLECDIDNGNHLLLSGNYAAMEYLDITGATDQLIGPKRAVFPFMDLSDASTWNIEFNPSRFPVWIFNKKVRVPGASLRDHLSLLKLMKAGEGDTLGNVINVDNPLYERLINPLSVAVINMTPETASAKLMYNVLKETALKGGTVCQPRIARHSLARSFVNPALDYLKSRGVTVHFGRRLKALSFEEGRVSHLEFSQEIVDLKEDDIVILALPPGPTNQIIDTLNTPLDYSAILNLHFKLDAPIEVDWPAPLIGLIGGISQWVFIRDNVASVTISAGNNLLDMPAAELAQTVWNEIFVLFKPQKAKLPPNRVIKEKRATLAQSPELEFHRPSPVTQYKNLYLAGDWTDTGLPATIEGAIRSGYKAARLASERAIKTLSPD